MARRRPGHASDDPQLTLEGWEKTLSAEREQSANHRALLPPRSPCSPTRSRRSSPRSSRRGSRPRWTRRRSSARLLTLDQLVAELPPAKRPQTWKRWLYERTRRNEIPGCVKLGGMLFFEREPALAWLRAGATTTR